jgi:beta-xylosidase
MALIQTRIAAGIHTSAQDAHIVFDKVGNSYLLSEIWAPGIDGYMLNVTKEKHEHMIVNTPK